MKTRNLALAAAAVAATVVAAPAARAGTYANITIDGNFSDWDNVPVAATSTTNAAAPIDFASLKIANDSTNVYFLLTFATPVNPQSGDGTYLAVDSDNDGTTGYNIFGNSAIGSNFGLENTTAFTETQSMFNSNATGSTINNATVNASPYNTTTSMQELSVPLIASQTDTSAGGYSGLIFPTSFTVEFYSDQGAGDTVGPVEYTLADATATPEPTSLALLGLGVVPLLHRRRRADAV